MKQFLKSVFSFCIQVNSFTHLLRSRILQTVLKLPCWRKNDLSWTCCLDISIATPDQVSVLFCFLHTDSVSWTMSLNGDGGWLLCYFDKNGYKPKHRTKTITTTFPALNQVFYLDTRTRVKPTDALLVSCKIMSVELLWQNTCIQGGDQLQKLDNLPKAGMHIFW